MNKKILFIFLITFLLILKVFSLNDFKEQNLYYLDKDGNGKIDSFFIDFNKTLTGTLDLSKIFLYSNTGGLSTKKLDSVDGNTIFKSYMLSGNSLELNLFEQDNYLTGLIIDNTTSSHLRLKTNAGIGIKDLDGNELKLLYTSSFLNYSNVFYKQFFNNTQNEIIPQPIKDPYLSGFKLNIESNSTFDNFLENQTEYICNTKKCLLNLSLKFINNSGALVNLTDEKASCEFDFGNSLPLQKLCNPEDAFYNTGIYYVTYNIVDKNYSDNIFSGNLKIINNFSEPENVIESGSENIFQSGSENITNSGSENQIQNDSTGSLPQTSTNSGSEMINSGAISSGNINIYNTGSFRLNFQNATYFTNKNLGLNNYLCDDTKTECKVNFNLEFLNSGSYIDIDEKKFYCKIDYGFETIVEKNTCNPGSFSYPIGDFNLNYKIYLKSNDELIFTKDILIKNTGYNPNTSTSSSYSTPQINYSYNLIDPEIVVQSGLDENNFCTNDNCKINFLYETQSSSEKCIWNFGKTTGEENKCNPPTIDFGSGKHIVKLKTYYSKDYNIFKTTTVNFESKKVETVENDKNYFAKINLQTKVKDGLFLSGNTIFCDEKCSLNFNSDLSVLDENLKYNYLWDFGNGITSTSINPKTIEFGTGKYVVSLNINNNSKNYTDTFYINVNSKENIDTNYSLNKPLEHKNLIISKIFPNPKGNDFLEYIELQNISNFDIPLDNCELQNNSTKATKTFKLANYGNLKPNQSLKIFNFDSNLNLPNSKNIFVKLNCDNIFQDSFIWNNQTFENMEISKDLLEKNITKIENQKDKIVFYSGENLIFQEDKKLINPISDIKKLDIENDKKAQKIVEVYNKTFSIKTSKQKSGLKISGNTLPNSKILLDIYEKNTSFLNFFIPQTLAGDEPIEIKTDENGDFNYLFKSTQNGIFLLNAYLKVSDETSVKLDKTLEFDMSNTDTNFNVVEKSSSDSTNDFVSKIILQTKSSSKNQIFSNKIICLEGTCSINFSSKETSTKLNYFWDFGNQNFSKSSNPKSITFGVGKYIVYLSVNDGKNEKKDSFIVEVLQKDSLSNNKTEENIKTKITPNLDLKENNINFGDLSNLNLFYTLLLFLVFLVLGILVLRKKELI